jgi:hypothetical protein
MSYTGAGIICGECHPEMVPLFAKHNIPMDFERRGLYSFPSDHDGRPDQASA